MSSSQAQTPSQPRAYQYSFLPTDKSIRLIKFCSGNASDGGTIRINLSIHSLETVPAFQCLSYAWENPTSPYSEDAQMSELVYESTGEIDVDHCTLSVKYNLHDALEMLRSEAESDCSKYFWIDAICINQADLAERASQVSIMDQIYGTAERVIFWVGQEDEFTEDAFYAIKTIGNIPKERHSELQAKDWHMQNLALPRVGAQPLHWKRWLGMIAFFNRPTFQRIWVVQEVILAKSVTLICGNEQLPWELISNTVSFLATTKWLIYLSIPHFRTNPVAMIVPGIYKKLMEDQRLELSQPLMYIEQIRTNVERIGHACIFVYLLSTFRLSDASDPRDKVYALLGLAWKERPPFSTHPDVLIPNYTISVRALYIKTARVMIQSHGHLRTLTHVEDGTFRKMQDLPSWVPDYSLRVSTNSLDSQLGRSVYMASKGLEYIADPLGYEEETLTISGFQLSIVTDVVDRFPTGVWEEKTGELDDHFIKVFQFAAEISETQMRTINPSLTRAQILWRTMCGDVVSGQHPAPSDIDEEFFKWLCFWIMARTFVFEENLYRQRPELQPPEDQKRWERVFRPIRQLLEQEPDTSTFHIDIFESCFGEAVTTTDDYTSFEYVRSSYARWWTGVLDHHGGRRRQLQDSDRRLCMALMSSEIGDEVWIIAGMPTPCLLRKEETGKYKFLGEVYIQGIMKGELADHNLLKPVSTITIV